MTSNVKIVSNNFPVKVETYDNGKKTAERIVLVGDDLSQNDYITITREVRFIDLEHSDPAVKAEQARRQSPE